jgi:hypothetical protein
MPFPKVHTSFRAPPQIVQSQPPAGLIEYFVDLLT